MADKLPISGEELKDELRHAFEDDFVRRGPTGLHVVERDVVERNTRVAMGVLRPLLNQDSEPEPETTPPLTPEFIEERLDHTLLFSYATNSIGIIGLNDHVAKLGHSYGIQNVFGSLFYDEDELRLGVFIKKDAIPSQE